MQVNIIIPAYNEEQSICKTINSVKKVLEKIDCDYQIIVVNDASTDRTKELLLPMKDVIIINHDCNRGYGASIKSGVRKSIYDTILITDADGTYPFEQIPEMLKNIKEYDMVVGARTGTNVSIPVLRRPAKWMIKKLAEYLSEKKIEDLNSGLRLIKKEVIKKFYRILPDGFSFTTTITLAMLTNDYQIKYIPIDYNKRTGKSKIRPIRDTLNFIQLIIRTVLYFNPLKIFLPISLFLIFLSAFVLLYSFLKMPEIMDITTIVLFVSGIHLTAIGMIADLIDKRFK
jgi:glycosyltransferase involved in cell wall biosynthesis